MVTDAGGRSMDASVASFPFRSAIFMKPRNDFDFHDHREQSGMFPESTRLFDAVVSAEFNAEFVGGYHHK